MIKSNNFITIQGWMRNELELKGNDLLVYAIIHGFSQTENQMFTGSLQYLADWCGATKQGISKNLKNLLDRNLIAKHEEYKNGVKFVAYYTTEFNGVYNSVERGIQLSLINNIDNTQIDKIDKNNSKELLQDSDFEFGKAKPKKDNLYTKCARMIDEFINSHNCGDVVRENLFNYLEYRLAVRDKPLYANMWKGMLKKLDDLHKQGYGYSPVIEFSLERGYLSFYPPSNYTNGIKNESGVRHVPRMTEEDYREEEGKQVYF